MNGELTPFELEVAEAMTACRDSARRLCSVLSEGVAGYEGGMAIVSSGQVLDILATQAASSVRRRTSVAISEFELSQHRFRLALIAVAIDGGLNSRQIGEAFGFSRQLASKYIKEARVKWPEVESNRVGQKSRA